MPPETSQFVLQPIGTVLGGRDEWVEDNWYGVAATIRLDESRFDPGAVQGLDAFPHLEVVFLLTASTPRRFGPILDQHVATRSGRQWESSPGTVLSGPIGSVSLAAA